MAQVVSDARDRMDMRADQSPRSEKVRFLFITFHVSNPFLVHLVRAQVSSTTTLFDMATIATQKRMNVEMNAQQVKSDWHTRQVPHVSSFVTL